MTTTQPPTGRLQKPIPPAEKQDQTTKSQNQTRNANNDFLRNPNHAK